ncbi:hypothetical protein [Dasania marina]|uniref:arsenate reductase/protein-tyrosine-phosphatase family protein n=1 Tax=Dasania marina TaxID=471499 RepID=UPI0030D9194F|tara:strand:+ start:86474 stop:87031 length:558 start_codon:yes stop_codon:yes gene_type:complete
MYEPLSLAIKNHYGSKRGMLNYYKYQLLLKLGFYNKYKNIDFSKVKRFVFVCSGNICRSPLAEVVARQKGVNSVSFGLHCHGGAPADKRAILFAEQHGFDLTDHKARNITDYKPELGDLVIGMEPKHTHELELLRHVASEKISLISVTKKKPQAYLHDPFNTNKCFFNKCEMEVVKSVEALVGKK